jgi:hypothetical protein
VRYRITGAMDKIKLTYQHTCVETPESLCQIMCWSFASKEEEAKRVFDAVVRSLVEKAPDK